MGWLLRAGVVLVVGAAMLQGSTSWGTSYYVSPSGTDANNGLTQATPFKEIQTALNAATQPGDIVYVMPGLHIPTVFYTSATMQRLRFMGSGSADNPITLTTLPGATQKATIDLRNVSAGYWGFTTNYCHYITVDGGGTPNIFDASSYLLEITNVPGAGTGTWCFNIREGHDCILRNVALTGASRGCMEHNPAGNCLIENVYARNADGSDSHVMYLTGGSTGLTMRNCNLSNGGKHGVQCNGAQPGNHVFERSYFHDNKGAALNFMAGQNIIVRNCFLYSVTGFSENDELIRMVPQYAPVGIEVTNCSFYSNDPNGMPFAMVAYTGATATIRNSIMYTPKDSYIETGNTLTGDYNLFYGGIAQFGSNSFNGNPNFVSASTGNLHLSNGSAAVDAAYASYAPTNDIDGNSRPSGAGVDLGADEGVGVTPPQNLAPVVDAGVNRSIQLPVNQVSLDATVSDDGKPTTPGTVTATWRKVSGPGTVTFGNAASVDTTATFTVAGDYVLALDAYDGSLTNTDTCTVAVKPAMPSGAVIDNDFQAGVGNWNGTAWTRADSGGGAYVFRASGGESTNTTQLPVKVYIDTDVKVSTWTAATSFCVYFHMQYSDGCNYQKAYRLQYVDDYGTDNDGLKLEKKVDNYGAIQQLAFTRLTLDTNVHHLRIISNGTGNIQVFFDNMDNPVLQYDDAAFIGAINQYVGIGTTGVVCWIDNIKVYGEAAPQAVTNLALSDPDWFKLTLTWTAPWDLPPGPVTSYDIRYSTSTINDSNWASATQVAGEPTPGAAGYLQSFTVTGLSASTTYYFAMKSTDAASTVSALSNVASATTSALDSGAPNAVTNLGVDDVRPNRVTLSWTTTGDDAASGTATTYDIRYATSPINASNWNSATQVIGEPAPKVAGSIENAVITGLTASTTYYFAIKVGDEVPNWSNLSNIASAATLAADASAPAAISDLQVLNRHIKTATLRWTTPADVGSAGVGSYDVRYSTSPITEGSWASASQATGEPAPAVPGVIQTFMVIGLSPQTTYYFAIKSSDVAEPANVSGISNVVSTETLPPVPAVTVQNPWIVNDRVADCRSLTTMGNTFDKAYTPDGVVSSSDIETRCINEYNNFKRRLYHWGAMPPNNQDVVEQMNVFGWALCGSQAGMNLAIIEQMGIHGRRISIDGGGHTIWEAEYGSKWHTYDTMCTYYVYNRSTPANIASMAEVKTDKNLVLNAVAEGRACPGFLLCGDTPSYFANGSDTWTVLGDPGDWPTTKSMSQTLRIGEGIKRTCESWATQFTNNTTAPYHHEAVNDWKDTVNLPYWEPYKYDSTQNSAVGISYGTTYRRWANGNIALTPDFASAGYQAALQSGSTNIATYNDDGLSPELHTAATGAPAVAVFKIVTPYYITDGNLGGTFVKSGTSDVNRLYVSPDGSNWTRVWDNSAVGTTQLTNFNVRSVVFGYYQMWVKVELQSTGAKTDAGVSGLTMTAIFEHNKGSMPYLDKGTNNITVSCDNPQDITGSAKFKVTYKWKEYDGTGWNVDRVNETYVSGSPFTYTINVGGTKVPRTEYILMEVTAPPVPDGQAPSAVSNLGASNPDSTTIDLSWTATGDDGNTGTASTYDVRYSTSPITDANWPSATQATGEPAPAAAGTAETFTVTGLSSSTTYYFAIKVNDEGGNISQLSNAVSATTAAPDVTAPAQITNLAAATSTTSGAVDLTWTAPGDDGSTGKAKTYDIRYSTSTITSGNFNSSTQVTAPAPKTAGSTETFTISGLTLGTTYYFAIKTADEVPNTSAISNVPSATPRLGIKTLQNGLNSYGGCRDAYIQAGNATTNYGAIERMRVTGYADGGATNVQRGLVRFDLSSIPTGTTITSAKLWLYSYDATSSQGSSGYYGAYPLTRDWTETGATWNSAGGAIWTTPGGDFGSTADGTVAKQTGSGVWYVIDLTSRIQQCINSSCNNYGWVIKLTDENLHSQDSFYQSDTSNASYRPKLVISDLAADTTAPAAVTNLAATQGASGGQINLTWTAPGDDGGTGTATLYDIRYSTSTITDANWASATLVAGEPTPGVAGTTETLTVSGLLYNQTYYFAMKTSDEVPNLSTLSNVPSASTAALGNVTLSTDKVTYISLTNPANNYGTGNTFSVSGYGATETMRGLLFFDCTSIPAGTTITSAKMRLYATAEYGGSRDYVAHKLTRGTWVETGATWNNYASGSAWTTAGGDYDTTVIGRATKDASATNVWVEFDVTAAAQAWISTSSTNYGMLIKVEDETGNVRNDFTSDENADTTHRPQLLLSDAAATTVAFNAASSSGNESVTSVNIPVSLNASASQTVTVQYAVTGGTATGTGTDYTLAAGTLTFNAGVTSQNIPVTIVNDALDENDETIIVTLSSPTNAGLGTSTTHTYTITDDDAAPTVQFAATSSSGSESATAVTLAVTLSAASSKTVTVNYAVTGGTAATPADFTISGTGLTFTPSDTSKNISITMVDDSAAEANETIQVTLSSPSNATLGTNTVHTYTINDNDNVAPTVNAGPDQTVTLPASASLDATVTDDGYPNPPATVTVTWSKVSGPGTVTFGNASVVDTTASFSVDGTYVLRLTVSDSVLSTSDDVTATVDPAVPTIYINDNFNDNNLDGWTVFTSGGYPTASGGLVQINGSGTRSMINQTSLSTGEALTYEVDMRFANSTAAIGEMLFCNSQYTSIPGQGDSYYFFTLGRDYGTWKYSLGRREGWSTTNLIPSTTLGSALSLDTWYHVKVTNNNGQIDILVTDPSQTTVLSTSYNDSARDLNGPYCGLIGFYANAFDGDNFKVSAASGGGQTNVAPTVNAGNDQAVTLPASATLDATVTDDGLPNPPATLTYTWSKVSGPGTVTFGNASACDTTASFSTSGTYVLQLLAGDSALSATDTLTVTVNAASNTAPSVNAGNDQTITLPASATLDATVTDDSLPNPPATLTYTWSKASGPGTVTFGNASACDTTASFSTSGTYVLQLLASDSALSATDTLTVTVNAASNTAPSVNAGNDQTITLPASATLDATVTDDGLPNPPAALTYTWSKVSGPGTVTFGNASACDTTASFSTSGTYVLQLQAGDSSLSTTDTITITVNASGGTTYIDDNFSDNDLNGWAVFASNGYPTASGGLVQVSSTGTRAIVNQTALSTSLALVYEVDVRFPSSSGAGSELMFCDSDYTTTPSQGDSHYSFTLGCDWGTWKYSLSRREGWTTTNLIALTALGSSLSTNTWYHVKVTNNNGQISMVVTDPSQTTVLNTSYDDSARDLNGAYSGAVNFYDSTAEYDNFKVSTAP